MDAIGVRSRSTSDIRDALRFYRVGIHVLSVSFELFYNRGDIDCFI